MTTLTMFGPLPVRSAPSHRLPVCEALIAHVRSDHTAVVEHMWPLRRRLHEFGSSHAQRDAVQKPSSTPP
ncbi:hypothetical protein ACFXGT_21765 [Streptomyces sp. NPDC059352]|uniref:hypothetical protein n=1 Tax=Streptomyces sp. NPDC059352 TaxID=3346810 RepID=UPI0036CE12F5